MRKLILSFGVENVTKIMKSNTELKLEKLRERLRIFDYVMKSYKNILEHLYLLTKARSRQLFYF